MEVEDDEEGEALVRVDLRSVHDAVAGVLTKRRKNDLFLAF